MSRFAVSLARNGRQALEALQSPEGEHINLILTDVLMPEVRWLSAYLPVFLLVNMM